MAVVAMKCGTGAALQEGDFGGADDVDGQGLGQQGCAKPAGLEQSRFVLEGDFVDFRIAAVDALHAMQVACSSTATSSRFFKPDWKWLFSQA